MPSRPPSVTAASKPGRCSSCMACSEISMLVPVPGVAFWENTAKCLPTAMTPWSCTPWVSPTAMSESR